MSALRYAISKPLEAAKTFWQAFTGTQDLKELIADEETRLHFLRKIIGFYKLENKVLPESLEMLSLDKDGSKLKDPYIPWRGKGTFVDSFGYPYQYSVSKAGFELSSPGLDTAKNCLKSLGSNQSFERDG